MKYKLSLNEFSKTRNGESMDGPGEVIQYRVDGLPEERDAGIALYPEPSKWSILRTIDGIQGEWKGSYATAEKALAALESEVNQEPESKSKVDVDTV